MGDRLYTNYTALSYEMALIEALLVKHSYISLHSFNVTMASAIVTLSTSGDYFRQDVAGELTRLQPGFEPRFKIVGASNHDTAAASLDIDFIELFDAVAQGVRATPSDGVPAEVYALRMISGILVQTLRKQRTLSVHDVHRLQQYIAYQLSRNATGLASDVARTMEKRFVALYSRLPLQPLLRQDGVDQMV